MRTQGAELAGRRLLVVEDDYFLAEAVADVLREAGAVVIGPVPSVESALDLIGKTDRLDGAVLDVNLQGKMAWPVADALADRAVPLVFATGYDADVIPARHARVPRCEKPVPLHGIVRALIDR